MRIVKYNLKNVTCVLCACPGLVINMVNEINIVYIHLLPIFYILYWSIKNYCYAPILFELL